MSASTPIVASNIPGFASVMTNGREGLMVPPMDEAAMAEAIKRLIENPGLRAQLGVDGRATVDRYRWDRVADTVLNYYDEVRDKQPVPPAKYQGW
jgi:glycosyltransferase involved in cell wall biosynthesis